MIAPTAPLVEKYRPRTLDDIKGQDDALKALRLFLKAPMRQVGQGA